MIPFSKPQSLGCGFFMAACRNRHHRCTRWGPLCGGRRGIAKSVEPAAKCLSFGQLSLHIAKSEDSKIRCGVVGTGYLGQHHARICCSGEYRIGGIVEADDARAEEICRRTSVSVLIPASTGRCLRCGQCGADGQALGGRGALLRRHLLIEKPLCTSLAEAEKILARPRLLAASCRWAISSTTIRSWAIWKCSDLATIYYGGPTGALQSTRH